MSVHSILPPPLTEADRLRSRGQGALRELGGSDEHGDPLDPQVHFTR